MQEAVNDEQVSRSRVQRDLPAATTDASVHRAASRFGAGLALDLPLPRLHQWRRTLQTHQQAWQTRRTTRSVLHCADRALLRVSAQQTASLSRFKTRERADS